MSNHDVSGDFSNDCSTKLTMLDGDIASGDFNLNGISVGRIPVGCSRIEAYCGKADFGPFFRLNSLKQQVFASLNK
ncbi:MAG: hypothetical protein V3V22_03770 [Methylococcales bacterium]